MEEEGGGGSQESAVLHGRRKTVFDDTAACLPMGAHSSYGSIHRTYASSSNPDLQPGRGGEKKVPALAEELLGMDGFQERQG